VDADPRPLLAGEAREAEVVQIDEAVEQRAARIDLHREPGFGEVDLDRVRTLREA
jgi:hypothetical protein